MDCAFYVVPEKAWLNTLPRFSSLSSPRSCRVLHFACKSVVHLELISVKGVMSVYRFIVLHVGIQFSTPFAEKTLLSPLNCLCSFVRNQLTVFVKVCFWVLCSVSLIYLFILWPVPHYLDYSVCVCVSCLVVSDSLQPHRLCSPPGPSVHGILQARTLEWVAIAFSDK